MTTLVRGLEELVFIASEQTNWNDIDLDVCVGIHRILVVRVAPHSLPVIYP